MFMTDRLGHIFGWSAAIIAPVVLVTLVVLNGLANFRTGKEYLQYELSEEGIAVRYQGKLLAEIPLTEIALLTERSGWLIIRSNEPVKEIAVPREVEGIEDLKAALSKFREIVPAAGSSNLRSALPRFLPRLLAASVATVLLFAGRNRAVIALAAIALLPLQVLGILSYSQMLKAAPGALPRARIVLLVTALLLFWLLTGWILHTRGIIS